MSRCLNEAGWAVELSPDGSIEASYPSEQRSQYLAAMQACQAEFGYDLPLPSLSPPEAEALLDQIVSAADCLRSRGFAVPEAPSRQASIDGLVSSRDPRWDIYADIPPGDQQADARAQCRAP